MARSTFSFKRAVGIAACAAVALLAVLAVSLAVERQHQRRAQEVAAFYKVGLERCDAGMIPLDQGAPAVPPGDIGIDIYPAFSPSQFVRLSTTSVQGFEGGIGPSPAPPPPPPGVSTRSRPVPLPPAKAHTPAPIPLDPAFGKRLTRVLANEIEHADADRRMGLDGVGFFLRHGQSCAYAWSPPDDIRQGRIIRLVEDLYEASRSRRSDAATISAKLDKALGALEAEARAIEE